jgi:hypothetical protein
MKIKTISYQRVVNLGNYESKRLELFAEVQEGEDEEVAISALMEKVEGFQRSKELADFFETAPQPPSKKAQKAWQDFYNSQHERWIQGNEQPPPVNTIEDVDPRLRTPELERAFKMREIETAIASGGYSVLDVLMGQPMVDALNQIDPENSYSLVGYDDEFEDDEIYE